MKTVSKLLALTFLIVSLSACAGNAVSTQSEEDTLSSAYTQAAMTIGAPTSTLPATATAFPTIAITLNAPPTFAIASPTVQSTTSYSYTVSNSTANGCNDAAFLSDVSVADGTVFAPGESFTKTWEFQNTGTCDWNEDYLIVFSSGTDMDGETTEIDQDVLVGASGDISVSLTAPTTNGTYVGYWRMADEDGNIFGQSVYVMIVVSDSASTVTPTATLTEEATSTSTSIPQATETSTPLPTNTEVPTSTEESLSSS
ncbi:MAG: hypothetical protein IPP66_07530 [Anaerolineales bacterium]|nr:hypothetical protein [Anaerolineales bacterium]